MLCLLHTQTHMNTATLTHLNDLNSILAAYQTPSISSRPGVKTDFFKFGFFFKYLGIRLDNNLTLI